MYRAVALQASREGVSFDDRDTLAKLCRRLDLEFRKEGGQDRVYLKGEDVSEAIRTPEMDLLSSAVSALRETREAMTELQRKLGREGCIVAEGRDMGTVVFPGAGFKFFLTADPEVRAERRYLERIGRGEKVAREEVEENLLKRDEQDMTRPLAPLRPAADAKMIDTSDLNPQQVMNVIIGIVEEGRKEHGVCE